MKPPRPFPGFNIPTQIEINHVSDSHFHKDIAKNTLTVERLSLLEKHMKTQQCPINVLTGDLTDDGTIKQMVRAIATLRDTNLLGSTMILPGNHDYVRFGNQLGLVNGIKNSILNFQFKQEIMMNELLRCLQGRGLNVRAQTFVVDPFTRTWFWKFKKCIKVRKLMHVIFIEDFKVMLIMLDSNPHHLSEIDFARGHIGPRQLGALRGILNTDKFSDWRKGVFLHHHPVYHSFALKLVDSKQFLKAVWGTADIVAFGHKHEWRVWEGRQSQRWNGFMSAAANLNSIYPPIISTFTIAKDKITHQSFSLC